ncbi:MAG: hypothetical protein KatS3mg110_4074 [Pirellulaceae bacterium]|nr:MAG: hypothetical protein KatS3mg110_4074 [Pirellulaceae bacterium]
MTPGHHDRADVSLSIVSQPTLVAVVSHLAGTIDSQLQLR